MFGEKVAELRRKQHLSQEELADKCGIHRTYIGSIERGEKSPTLNTIEVMVLLNLLSRILVKKRWTQSIFRTVHSKRIEYLLKA